MWRLKSILSDIKLKSQQTGHVSLYFYHAIDELDNISYSDFFKRVDLVCLSIQKLREDHPNLNYFGLYTKHVLYLPVLILACIMMDQPFICLDNEAGLCHNIAIIESISADVIVTTSEEFEGLNVVLKLHNLYDEFELWGFKMQLWVNGKVNKRKKCEVNIMYAIQTSGSTGEPKTVQVPEESILPNISYLRSEWNVTSDDVILLVSPPTFDPFMVELLLALCCGAALFVIPPEVRALPIRLLDILFPDDCTSLVTIAQFTPSVFARWTPSQIRRRVLTKDTSLRVLALGGERFPGPEWWSACRAPGNPTRLCSLYGTTELSCWAMFGAGLDVTLGTAMSDTLLQVQAEDGTQLQDGTGQLFIGSNSRICLINEENWKKLQPPVFRATGDIVSVKNGVYRYIGRKDNVVKRWGHRVSLEQIEAVAMESADVTMTCCVLHDDCLALFVSLQEGSPSLQAVRTNIKQMFLKKLNKASLPDLILQQDHFPLTRHGKINRKKLRKYLVNINTDETNFKKTEDLFRALWKKYTHNEAEESAGFVNAGGNSVSAMQIVNCMRAHGLDETLATTIMMDMLNNKSLANCSKLLSAHPCSEIASTVVIDVESNEKNIKKLKRDHDYDEIIQVHMKGCKSNLLESLPRNPTLKIRWHYNLGKCVDATATCVVYKSGEIHVLAGSHSGRLAALDLGSGSVIWETRLPDRIESSFTASGDGSIGLIGCYNGAVYCVRLSDGAILWSFKTQAMIKGTAIWFMDSWLFGSYDYCVYCIKDNDGKLVWSHRTDGPVLVTPVILPTPGLLAVASLSGQVVALHCSSGAVAWQTTLSSPVFSTPCLIVSPSILLVAEVAGTLHALHPATGIEIWQFKAADKIFSSLVSFEDVVVFGCHDNHAYCLRCSTDIYILLWTLNMGSAVYATPCCLLPQYVVIATSKGHVIFVDITSSELLANIHLPGEIFSSPIAINNSIIVGCRDNNIYCLLIDKL